MSSCCETKCAPQKKNRKDWFLIITGILIVAFYSLALIDYSFGIEWLSDWSQNTFELLNKMWWGLLLGIVFVGILNKIPRQAVQTLLGKPGSRQGVLRATIAGLLLDMCSHGILLVGMKFYERGASLGQVMAFLIASPWNSFSLTLILWALVGFWWMLAFVVLSLVVAVISGFIFDKLVTANVLPNNPHSAEFNTEARVIPTITEQFQRIDLRPRSLIPLLKDGLKGSKMILKWIFFGAILAAAVRTFVSPEMFETAFGPTLAGLGITLLVATILEVCSEGSTPIAADILTRAQAPGNAFSFLMTGVATDYTEIMSLKETTGRWKIAFFLPLVTLPQVVLLGIILNQF
jgi:uncharacterized membrane protein YraQ (UPF0718 family)